MDRKTGKKTRRRKILQYDQPDFSGLIVQKIFEKGDSQLFSRTGRVSRILETVSHVSKIISIVLLCGLLRVGVVRGKVEKRRGKTPKRR